jgi:hypothetical protein
LGDDDKARVDHTTAPGQRAGLDPVGPGTQHTVPDSPTQPNAVHTGASEHAKSPDAPAVGGELENDELDESRLPEHEDERRLATLLRPGARDPVA